MSLTITDLPSRLRERINLAGGIPPAPLFTVDGECWLYDGWHNDAGYPYTSWDGRDQPVHRVLFTLMTGDDITGLDLDHVCRVVACVRPSHHEAVSHAENQRRIALAQTCCRRAGHDWTDPRNVRVRPNGRRWCAEEPHEIQAAMAFHDAYRVLGNRRERVRQLGNAVTPPAAEYLLTAVSAALEGTGRETAA